MSCIKFLSRGENGSIMVQIIDCLEVKNIPKVRGGPGYAQTELRLLDQIAEQFGEHGWLTELQTERLNDLWSRI